MRSVLTSNLQKKILAKLQYAAILLCALIIAGCGAGIKGTYNPNNGNLDAASEGHDQSPLKKKNNVKVALLLPIGSKRASTANIAKNLKQAGELALFDFDNPNIVLLTKDTKGTPEGAKAAAEAAVSAGAELIIGPLFAKSVKAAAPVTRGAKIPMIAFSSDQSVAGDGIYLLSFLAGRDLPRIVKFAISQGKTRFAGLVPKTAYGSIIQAAFKDAVQKNGGQLIALETYPRDANGMLEPVKKISELTKDEFNPVDTLLLTGGPKTLPSLSPLLPYFEIDTEKVQLIGTGQWNYANIGREKSLHKAWYPAPEPKGWQNFTQRYAKTYGKPPQRISSLAYDAVSLAVSLAANPKSQRFSEGELTRASGFAGIDGLFRLLPDGTSERGLAVLEVQKFSSKVVDPAPSAFSQAEF